MRDISRKQASSKALYELRKAQGLCGKCGARRERPELVLCAACLERQSQSHSKLYFGRKTLGQCTRCPRPCSATSTLCEQHREYQAAMQRRNYEQNSPERKRKQRAYDRARRAKRRESSPDTPDTSSRRPR